MSIKRVYLVGYMNKGFHSKRYDNLEDAIKDFRVIQNKYQTFLKTIDYGK